MASFNVSISSFPLMTLGIPMATVCPLGIRPAVPSPNLTTYQRDDDAEAFQPMSMPTTSLIASSIVTASAKLPDGSMTTFSSLARREVDKAVAPDTPFVLPGGIHAIQLGNDTPVDTSVGKMVVGSEGCQTLYSPTVRTVCSTVISPVGIPPVTVTDCEQYITFSSETLFSCAPTPTVSPLPASSDTGITPTYSPLAASITTIPTSSSTENVEAESATANESTSIDTSSESTTTSDSSTSSVETAGFVSPLTRRDLVYTTAPTDDTPMSIARQLLPEYGIDKRQLFLSDGKSLTTSLMTMSFSLPTVVTLSPPLHTKYVHDAMGSNSYKRQLESADSLVITIVNSTNTQENTYVSLDSTASGTQPLPEPTDDTSVTSTPTASDASMLPSEALSSIPSLDTAALLVHAVQLSPPQPTKYYAAPWYQLTGSGGGVPTNVKGITCLGGLAPVGSCVAPDTDGDTESCECDVDDEIWSVTSFTLTRIGTTVVSFDGSVVMTASGLSLTTSLSVTQVLTTTQEEVVGHVVKSTITLSSRSDEATLYETETSFPSVTMTLLPGDGMSETNIASVSATGLQSSSVVNAAAPQSSPASISYPTALSTTELPASSGTLDADTEIEGTTFVTSFIATETVIIPPSNAAAGATASAEPVPARQTIAPMPGLTGGSVSIA